MNSELLLLIAIIENQQVNRPKSFEYQKMVKHDSTGDERRENRHKSPQDSDRRGKSLKSSHRRRSEESSPRGSKRYLDGRRRTEDSHHSRHRRDEFREDRRDHTRDHREDRRHRSEREELKRKIKEEPLSDEEQSRRPRREEERETVDIRVKEEPQSDTEDRRPRRRNRFPREEDVSQYQYGHSEVKQEEPAAAPVEKQKPNFGLSGKLTEEKNIFNGVVVKYSEPPEARVPKRRWRFYVFKGEESLPTLYLHRQSAYLLGRDRKVADIPIDHPSCSKQQAVLQFRLITYDRQDGTTGRTVRPYVIDLESANGTFVNGNKIESKRYVELFEKDVLKFGFSTREYVLLHEDSKAEAGQDDMGQE